MNARAVKSLMMTVACLATVTVWGRSFSIDLRPPASKAGVQVRANGKLEAAVSSHGDDALRRTNLDAGAADVGRVAVGDELAFALFEDVSVTLTVKRKMPAPLGGDVFLAEASGYEGVKNAVVLRTADGLTVDVQDYRSGKIYKVVSAPTGVTVREMAAKGGSCGCDTLEPPAPDAKPVANSRAASKGAVSNGTDTGKPCVDILVAYDTNAATWANANGGGITNFAETAVQKMNTALANTGLDEKFCFRLVGVTAISASESDVHAALYAIRDGAAGWADVKTAREAVSAARSSGKWARANEAPR